MYTRLLKPIPKKSFFLFGPRGTGKTTWVKNTFPHALYLDLLESELFTSLLANPQRLEQLIPPNFTDYVIIDEIQRVPRLLNEVHRLIESRGCIFVLTGSSARKLRAKGENLLAGRALTYHFSPLTALEASQDFSIESALQHGLLAAVFSEPDPKLFLNSYVKTYLEEEISQEGLTRNLPAFARFLEVASFSQASLVNVSSVAREAGIHRKVAENYFTILEDLLLSYRIPAFQKRAGRNQTAHPKFYFFDVGVYKTIRPMGPLDDLASVQGIAIETLFLQNLIAINQALQLNYQISYYQTTGGKEVDFVLYGERGFIAFEIKRTTQPGSRETANLRHFQTKFPQAKTYLIYGGTRTLYTDKITIIPFLEALLKLPDILS